MARRKVVFMVVLCPLTGVLGVQALARMYGAGSGVPQPSAEEAGAEVKREVESWRKETKLARERKEQEAKMKSAERKRAFAEKLRKLAKEGRGPLIDREEHAEGSRKEAARIRSDFLREKSALEVTPEQWELIKPKLEKVRQLQDQANSKVGVFLAGGSSSGTGPNGPAFQWKNPWKDKDSKELTESQRLVKQLIGLVGRESTTPQAFRLKMTALRKARSEDAEIRRQLADARRELRTILTTRQEATLVLMNQL